MVAYLCSRDDRLTRLDWDGAVTSAAATVRRTGARASMPPPSGHPSARSAEPGRGLELVLRRRGRLRGALVPWVRGLFRHLHGQRETMNRAPAHGNTPETLPDIGP